MSLPSSPVYDYNPASPVAVKFGNSDEVMSLMLCSGELWLSVLRQGRQRHERHRGRLQPAL
jgi:hypothetical protein